jgi:hypothetical protein
VPNELWRWAAFRMVVKIYTQQASASYRPKIRNFILTPMPRKHPFQTCKVLFEDITTDWLSHRMMVSLDCRVRLTEAGLMPNRYGSKV